MQFTEHFGVESIRFMNSIFIMVRNSYQIFFIDKFIKSLLNKYKIQGGFFVNIGGQIYKYRSELGLSQDELGNKLNVTIETVSSQETNEEEPSLENLKNLATIFEITLDQLLENDTEEKDILVLLQIKLNIFQMNNKKCLKNMKKQYQI